MRWLFASLAVVLAIPGIASAQPSEGAEVGPRGSAEEARLERARGFFEEGAVAHAEGDLERAREAFESSLALRDFAPTRYMLATVLLGLAEAREAARHLEILLRDHADALTAAQLADVRRRLSEVRRLLGTVRVELPVGSDVRLRVNGETVEDAVPGERYVLRLNPGRHVVAVVGELRSSDPREIEVEAGSDTTLDFRTPPDGGPGAWPWILAGAGVVVVAAVIIGVVLGVRAQDDDVLGMAETLVTTGRF